MSLHNIFEHFRNALFQSYGVNPYHNGSTFKVDDRRLILSLPFDQWNYVRPPVPTLLSQSPPFPILGLPHPIQSPPRRGFVNTVTKGITHVGFLSMKTALIPGAVQVWIDAVVFAAEAPAPPTLGYEELQFFAFTPQMGHWLSCTPLAYCPLVCDLYYLDRLQQNKAWHYTDSEVDVPSVIPWYNHLDNSVLPSLFHLDA
ncbi:hypothetical protein PQX77_004939 [Marasmius sp. AFHP31]|nr:hypothetical protein PQX77_004939 [Marasmius sp. AFHP31]